MASEGLWHAQEVDSILDEYGVDSSQGLSSEQVAAHRQKYGKNELRAKNKKVS